MARLIGLSCLILATNVAVAQGLYFSANGTYGLGAGTQLIGVNMAPAGTAISYEGVYGSLGEGFKFGVSGGYLFSPHVAAEIGLSYWLGKSIELQWSTSTTGNATWSGKGLVAVPSLVFLSNLKPVNPYGKFGMVLGLLRTKEESNGNDPGGHTEYTAEETGGLTIGFAGALGVIVPTGGAVDFFAEVVLHSVTYSPDKVETTGYTDKNQNHVPTPIHLTSDYETSYTSIQPDVSLAVRRPFSSIGFSVGARITL